MKMKSHNSSKNIHRETCGLIWILAPVQPCLSTYNNTTHEQTLQSDTILTSQETPNVNVLSFSTLLEHSRTVLCVLLYLEA